MRALLVVVTVLVAIAACGTKEPAPPGPGTSPTPTIPTTPTAPADATAPAAGSGASAPADCAALNARFDATLAQGSGACTSAADCQCYPGGVGANPSCGGVTDQATAAALFALRADFARAHCSMPIQCGASVCAPRCDHGRCR